MSMFVKRLNCAELHKSSVLYWNQVFDQSIAQYLKKRAYIAAINMILE